jgi:dTDP-4-amino-4,6-dideoxy-D-galactose acyltransferase
MSAQIHYLNWDSEFFGYKVGLVRLGNMDELLLRRTVNDLREQDYRLAYVFADPSDVISNHSLKEFAGEPVDRKVTFFKELDNPGDYISSDSVRPYPSTHVSHKLLSLALQSGIYSRFNVDGNFRNLEFERLYTRWIEKSVEKEIAKEVLVFYEDDDEKGFITLDHKKNEGSIGLIAVDEQVRGKSIGRKLISSSFSYFRDNNVSIVDVVTQLNNNGACEFYKALGFKIRNITNVYHLWIR